MAVNLRAQIAAIPQATPYNLTTAPAPELPERAGVLSPHLQELARNYVGARQKTGESLLESARWLSEVRQEAKHGDWKLFLEATGTSDDTAERLLNIHAQAMQNPQFAESVRTQWIGQSAAALLALPSTPPEIIDRVLNAPEPMKVTNIRDAIKEAKHPAAQSKSADQGTLPDMPAPAQPTDLPPDFSIVQRRLAAHDITLLSNMQGHHRAFVTKKEGMTGVVTFDWADVLSKLERLESAPSPDMSAPAFRMTCPTCSEVIVNGVWGDLKECGSCYHTRQQHVLSPETSVYDQMTVLCEARDWDGAQALIDGLPGGALRVRKDFAAQLARARDRAGWVCEQCGGIVTDMRRPMTPICSTCVIQRQADRAPTVPPRPRRPISADVSAQIAYTTQLEAYASALEAFIMELQKRL